LCCCLSHGKYEGQASQPNEEAKGRAKNNVSRKAKEGNIKRDMRKEVKLQARRRK